MLFHSTFNNQGDLGDLYDHSMSTSIFTLILIKIFMMTSKNHEANGCMHNLDLLIIVH